MCICERLVITLEPPPWASAQRDDLVRTTRAKTRELLMLENDFCQATEKYNEHLGAVRRIREDGEILFGSKSVHEAMASLHFSLYEEAVVKCAAC